LALPIALREVGRLERTLFMIDWILDADMRRRAQIGLNKGEAHHALKRAISFHRRGEIRDRSREEQHYRIAGMNLLTPIIIFWNNMKLGVVVGARTRDGQPACPDLLAAPCRKRPHECCLFYGVNKQKGCSRSTPSTT
jgi:TnpA family transposase